MGEVAILYIPELLQVPELTGIDCLCLLILVGDDYYTGRGGGPELRQHYTTDHASIF